MIPRAMDVSNSINPHDGTYGTIVDCGDFNFRLQQDVRTCSADSAKPLIPTFTVIMVSSLQHNPGVAVPGRTDYTCSLTSTAIVYTTMEICKLFSLVWAVVSRSLYIVYNSSFCNLFSILFYFCSIPLALL